MKMSSSVTTTREDSDKIAKVFIRCLKSIAQCCDGKMFEYCFHNGSDCFGFQETWRLFGSRIKLYYNKKEVSEEEMLDLLFRNVWIKHLAESTKELEDIMHESGRSY